MKLSNVRMITQFN